MADFPSYKYRPPGPGNTAVRAFGSYWGTSFLVQCPGVDCLHTSACKCLEASWWGGGTVPEGGCSETHSLNPGGLPSLPVGAQAARWPVFSREICKSHWPGLGEPILCEGAAETEGRSAPCQSRDGPLFGGEPCHREWEVGGGASIIAWQQAS